MPKRSNEFQKLIYLIQNQLAENATVSESKILQDIRTGANAEVDIVIESRVGEIDIVVGIECTSKKRPVTVEWVREMIGKHQDLPINKSILVSKSGFSQEALTKALSHSFEAISFEQAGEADWVGIIDNLKNLELGSFEFKALSGNVVYSQKELGEETLIVSEESLIYEEGINTPVTLFDYITSVLSNSEVGASVMEKWLQKPKDQRKNYFEFTLTFPPRKKTKIQSDTGKLSTIRKFEIKASASVKTTPVSLSTGAYRDKKIAFASASNIFSQSKSDKDVLISIIQKDEGASSGSLLVPDFEGGEDKIFPMKFKKG
jgi:hypothetical protein